MADHQDPDRNPSSLDHDDCLDTYYDQAQLLWRQGTFSRRDRAILDQLRGALRLSVTEAAGIESRAARAAATPEELEAGDAIDPFVPDSGKGAAFLRALQRQRVVRAGRGLIAKLFGTKKS